MSESHLTQATNSGTRLRQIFRRGDHYLWISGGAMLLAGMMVLGWVHEIKQLAPGRWRPRACRTS